MDYVKSEDWKQLHMPHDVPRTNYMSLLRRSSSWRRPGEPGYFEGPVAQVNRPPCTARPQSCIEGGTTDKWLQTLKKIQSRPLQRQIPPFVDRTVSMPALPNEMTGGNPLASLQMRRQTPSVSPSLCDSSVGSLDSLETDGGLDRSNMVHIKPSPSTEKAKFCSLAPVRFGWLPIQRHVVLTDISNNGCRHENSRCQQKLKSPITPVLLSTPAKLNGSRTNDGEPEQSVRSESVGFSQKTPVKTSYSHLQASASASLEGGRNGSQAWNPTANRSPSEINKLPSKDPVYRRGSVPDSGRARTYSSSISSITITSRKVTRSSSLPDTSRPAQKFPGSMAMNDQPVNPPDSLSSHVMPQRKALVVKVTEQRMESKTTRRESSADEDHKGYDHPVVLRRKATIVKMVEQTERIREERSNTTKTAQYRCSYTEGLNTNDPIRFNTPISNPSLLNQPFTVSVQPGRNHWRSSTVQHRSSVSLHLNNAKDRSTVEDTDNKKYKSPGRPLSCDASLLNHTDSDANVVTHTTFHSNSSTVPHKTNIDLVSSSKEEEKRQSASSSEMEGLDAVIQKKEGSDPRSEIKPLTLLKIPDDSPPSTARAVLALNAAAVIANIRLQTRQRHNHNTPADTQTTPQTSTADDGKNNNSGIPKPGGDGRNKASFIQPGSEDISRDSALGLLSLPEALSIRRPDFIQRSQARVQALEMMSHERKRDALQKTLSSPHRPEAVCIQQQRADNLLKSKDRGVSGEEAHQQSRRNYNLLPEVRKRREEEKRRKEEKEKRKLVSRTNRLRAELFKKKVLDQVLQRGSN